MDPGSCPNQRYASEEVRKQKRKELDARRSKCRIRIGAHLEQWCELKERLGFSLHSQVAKFLLDRYNSSTGIAYTEHLNTAGGLCVSSDALQHLAVLCHDHSQECGFIPNLIHTMPAGDNERDGTLLWECLAGHTFSWSFSLHGDLDEVSSSHQRTEDVAKSVGSDISAAHARLQFSSQVLSKPCAKRKQKDGMQGAANLHRTRKDKRKRGSGTNQIGSAAVSDIPCTSEAVLLDAKEMEYKEIISETDLFYQSELPLQSEVRKGADTSCMDPLPDCRRSLRRVPAKCKRTARNPPDAGVKAVPMEVSVQSPGWMPDCGPEPACTELSTESGLQWNLNVNVTEEKTLPGIKDVNSEDQTESKIKEIGDQEQAVPEVSKTDDEAQALVGIVETNRKEHTVQRNREAEEGSHAEAITDSYIDDGIKNWRGCVKQNNEDIAQIGKKRIRRTAKREILLCDFEGCGKIFSNRQYLNHHKKYQHEQQKTFTCSEPSCGKSFNFKKHLKEHEKRHSDKRDFICEFCARGFRTSSNLIIHRRIHTGEKPLQCEICGFTCRQKASLNWHMKKHDIDSLYQFSCDACGKKFEKKDNVLAHRNKKHARNGGSTAPDPQPAPSQGETTVSTSAVVITAEART
ncbi:zinc finger protein 692 [Rhinatrema bivittatum]|uniref:zinc finger protein 692 n=1 Tax=Rhinatrema bivittatum TaxID=194408 RepID=UPI00112D125F|nr:zinc finger protein 692 [Rhinatrema bivittatum]XP_029428684.1 zinc finger protein 692 [Rhinatrema bivittatum]